jgi:hypothetical protein
LDPSRTKFKNSNKAKTATFLLLVIISIHCHHHHTTYDIMASSSLPYSSFTSSSTTAMRPVVMNLNQSELATLSNEKRRIVESLASLVQDELLYRPDSTFHEPLPQSQIQHLTSYFSLDELLHPPGSSFDTDQELAALSVTVNAETGKVTPRRLNQEQLQQLAERGEFEVPSLIQVLPSEDPTVALEQGGYNKNNKVNINNKQHQHVWKVARWLQKGRKNIATTFQQGLGRVLFHIIVAVPNRLVHNGYFSIRKGLSSGFKSGLLGVFNVFIGWKETSARFSEYELNELIREHENDFVRKRLLQQQSKEEQEIKALAEKDGDDDADATARLFDNTFIKSKPHLQRIVETIFQNAEDEWERRYSAERIKIKGHLDASEMKLDDLVYEKRLNRQLMRLRDEIVMQALVSNQELQEVAPGFGRLLAERQHLDLIISEVEQDLQDAVDVQREIFRQELTEQHPVLSLVDEWVEERVQDKVKEYMQRIQWDFYENASTIASAEGYEQMIRIYKDHILVFRRHEEPGIRQRLAKETVPARTFEFGRRIWRPSNWIRQEVTNRIGEKKFQAQKDRIDTIKSDQFGWRLAIIFHESRNRLCNGVYYLFRALWSGPMGIKSLVLKDAFVSRYTMDPDTGLIVSDRVHLTNTLRSRLAALRQHVRQLRQEFEALPDTGFLGKPISRCLNILSSYLGIAIPGTILLVIGQPLATIAYLVSSLLLSATAPVWSPASSLFGYAYSAIFFDLRPAHGPHTPVTGRWFPLLGHVIGDIGLAGVVQTAIAIVAGLVVHPGWAGIRLVWAVSTRQLRTAYDWAMRRALLRLGRVPGQDSFLAWRVAGPGITAKYCYQLRGPEICLLALTAKLEEVELDLFEQRAIDEIKRPLHRYHDFFKFLSDFDLKVAVGSSVNSTALQLSKLQESQLKDLKRKVQERRKQPGGFGSLDLDQSGSIEGGVHVGSHLGWIKQSSQDLERTLELSTKLVESYCKRLEEQYTVEAVKSRVWYRADVIPGKYEHLTVNLLSSIFSSEFLIPLEETDETIVIPVKHQSLEGLLEGLTMGTADLDD